MFGYSNIFQATLLFESLFYKYDIFLQKTTTCIELQAEQIFILRKYIRCIFFSILGVAFAVPFPSYFQKLQLFVAKIFRSMSFCMNSKRVS